MASERESIRVLSEDVQRSFSDPDTTRNLGVFSFHTGVGANGTQYDDITNLNTLFASNVVVTSMSWQDKVTRMRSQQLAPGTILDSSVNRGTDTVWYNMRYWRRIMVAGPHNEREQRYMIISLMTPVSTPMYFPTGSSDVLFNEFWSNNWEGSSAQPPPSWQSRIAPGDWNDWVSGANDRTNASRVIVQRITQQKFMVALVNNSSTDAGYVDIGPYTDALVLNGGSSVNVIKSDIRPEFQNGVPAGTLIVVRRGPNGGPTVEVQRFFLTAPATLTIQ
jgi:hypothetical protein